MSTEAWLLVLILLSGFYMAWNIGANDVANAMGTSVGSGALTLRQAICVAAILEFCGAYFFGSHVSETMQNGLIDVEIFENTPLKLVYGMLSCLIAAGLWLQIASFYGWPVSTTHTIVGSIVGFGFVFGGAEAIYWENVGFVFFSWLISPVCGGVISYVIFTLLRKKIFYSSNPLKAALQLTPYLVFGVTTTLALVMIYKGLKNLNLDLNFLEALTVSLFVGIFSFTLSYFLLRQTRHSDIPVNSEYAPVEKIFGHLQLMSACLMAFAHGANDVANAIGPLSASIEVLTTKKIYTQASIPTWALALGGTGIVVGLATWGWRVIETIGRKITELTPTRGFSAEFGAALTVLIASRIGMPISTTHTLVGSVIGVGLARGIEALDLRTTRDIMTSWLVTIPAGALLTVLVYFLIRSFI